jgi:hypothetical protein
MAEIRSIDINSNNILINLRVSKSEYEILKHKTHDLLLLPADQDTLDRRLTTGKLGNSNRIMLPKKLLERHNIKEVIKKAPSKAFDINDEVFLLIKLKKSTLGIPVFKEVKK